ncbi:unnamed protein product [Orchesella dallaii]|uniref:Uncharacterized protein n=1 Tax=Orchesella dallaii TaxID=48710 RepID=A0ABP1R773_9HEXA
MSSKKIKNDLWRKQSYDLHQKYGTCEIRPVDNPNYVEFKKASVERLQSPRVHLWDHPHVDTISKWTIPEKVLEPPPSHVQPNLILAHEYVDSRDQVDGFISHLEDTGEWAFDMERAKDEDYFGQFPALLQFSTHAWDIIVDPLPIWESILRLKPIFEDEKEDTHVLLKIWMNQKTLMAQMNKAQRENLRKMTEKLLLTLFVKKDRSNFRKCLNEKWKVPHENVLLFSKIFEWRDENARALDCNPSAILSDYLLHKLARVEYIPRVEGGACKLVDETETEKLRSLIAQHAQENLNPKALSSRATGEKIGWKDGARESGPIVQIKRVGVNEKTEIDKQVERESKRRVLASSRPDADNPYEFVEVVPEDEIVYDVGDDEMIFDFSTNNDNNVNDKILEEEEQNLDESLADQIERVDDLELELDGQILEPMELDLEHVEDEEKNETQQVEVMEVEKEEDEQESWEIGIAEELVALSDAEKYCNFCHELGADHTAKLCPFKGRRPLSEEDREIVAQNKIKRKLVNPEYFIQRDRQQKASYRRSRAQKRAAKREERGGTNAGALKGAVSGEPGEAT